LINSLRVPIGAHGAPYPLNKNLPQSVDAAKRLNSIGWNLNSLALARQI